MIKRIMTIFIIGIFLTTGIINLPALEPNEKNHLSTIKYDTQYLAGVVITNPADNDTVCGIVPIEVQASYDVTKVEFYIDDIWKYTDYDKPYSVNWNTPNYNTGPHILKAVGFNDSGNSGYDIITVYVNLSPEPVITGDNYAWTFRPWNCSIYVYDIEGDDIWYLIDYDNGEDSGWRGPYESGQWIKHDDYTWSEAGIFYVLVKAKDYCSESDWVGPLVVTVDYVEPYESDLDCEGNLYWHNPRVNPGGIVTGVFSVRNTGDYESNLNWRIDSYPDWGTWTFSQDSGYDLKPNDGWYKVEVSIVAPDVEEVTFEGNVTIVNIEDDTDRCSIPVSLYTVKDKSCLYLQIIDLLVNLKLRFSFIQLLFYMYQ